MPPRRLVQRFMPLGKKDYIRGSHPPACTCLACSPRREPRYFPKRDSQSPWWVGLWRRFKQVPWKTNVLVVSGSMSLAAFVLFPAALAGWVEENLQQQKHADLPTPSPDFDLPPTSALRPVSPVEQTEPAGGFLPASELEQYHQQLMGLINADREAHALSPVVLGNNSAAQRHAEDMLRHNYISHWDTVGLTPYMRYTLAGGEAYEAENAAWEYGGKSAAESLKEAQKALMNSPGHQRNILNKWHNQVNLGVACAESDCAVVQQFENDYVVFRVQPTISKGILRFAGDLKGDFTFQGAQLWYDQPPHPLTLGQLDATYSYFLGQQPATFLLKPLGDNSYYPAAITQHADHRSVDPYSLEPNIPRSSTPVKSFTSKVHMVPWITAAVWRDSGQTFEIEANISSVLNDLGPGVYTLIIWGNAGGESVPLTKYSLFMG